MMCAAWTCVAVGDEMDHAARGGSRAGSPRDPPVCGR
jgi:hypothetical protein